MYKYLHVLILVIQVFPLHGFSQYLGGNADGFALNILTQTVCPPVASTNVFLGGNADGFALNTLTQTVCPPVASTNVFLGGNADGFALNTLTQTVCPPTPSTNVFLGGNADGFAINILQQSVCTPLPIQLLSWEAQCEQKKAVLKWTTVSEINNDYFSIERSKDAINWSVIGKIIGAGSSNQPVSYSFADVGDLNGLAYYRLRQTDFNAKFEYFNIIGIDCKNNELKNILVYPNPNAGKFIVKSFTPEDTSEIKIYNFFGELILRSKISNGLAEIDLSGYSQGIYNVLITSTNRITLNKVIITR